MSPSHLSFSLSSSLSLPFSPAPASAITLSSPFSRTLNPQTPTWLLKDTRHPLCLCLGLVAQTKAKIGPCRHWSDIAHTCTLKVGPRSCLEAHTLLVLVLGNLDLVVVALSSLRKARHCGCYVFVTQGPKVVATTLSLSRKDFFIALCFKAQGLFRIPRAKVRTMWERVLDLILVVLYMKHNASPGLRPLMKASFNLAIDSCYCSVSSTPSLLESTTGSTLMVEPLRMVFPYQNQEISTPSTIIVEANVSSVVAFNTTIGEVVPSAQETKVATNETSIISDVVAPAPLSGLVFDPLVSTAKTPAKFGPTAPTPPIVADVDIVTAEDVSYEDLPPTSTSLPADVKLVIMEATSWKLHLILLHFAFIRLRN
ncbi:hypothetical protein Fmac_020855 [Flemingia macrophylla]|uniref:Uncharacterized protein n=1 Tax=Flemingia macrophylla TaxID=520843 RepID=A0ABD1LV87_9FABA